MINIDYVNNANLRLKLEDRAKINYTLSAFQLNKPNTVFEF